MSSKHRQHLAGYLQSHKVKGGGDLGKKEQKTLSAGSRPNTGALQVSKVRPGVSSSKRRPLHLRAVNYAGKPNINHLPDELLLKVFSYLEPADLLAAARVCKRWNPVACDNELWTGIYEQFCRRDQARGGRERCDQKDFKALCIMDCSQRRKKLCKKYLKKISPFTGLPSNVSQALKAGGVYLQLIFIDQDKNEHSFNSRDMFYHHMSVTTRWFELEMPTLSRMRSLQVFAINPLFFNESGQAIANSPYQKSLLHDVELKWKQQLQTNHPAGGDDMINIYNLSNGLAIATWKGDGELAFITLGLHYHQLVQRCLYGSPVRPYDVNTHSVIPDDIDSNYGLHGYKCTVDIRHQRTSVWSQQFWNLSCRKENIASGYAKFPLIRKDQHHDHVIFTKALHFPWKTDTFKGILENVVWLDVTVLDERSEPFWCVSTLCKIVCKKSAANIDFDYSMEEVYVLSYTDERGKIEAQMSLTDDKLYFMTGLDLKLSLDAINAWFQTSYR